MKKLLYTIALLMAFVSASFAQSNPAFDFIDPADGHSTGQINGFTDELDMEGGYKENGSNTLSNDISGNAATATTAGSTSGNAATASAAEANGANCPAGQAAGGVDTDFAAEACIDPITETEMDTLAELNTQLGTSIPDGAHTTNTNSETICVGTDKYLDGEGNCDTLSGGIGLGDNNTWTGTNQFNNTVKLNTGSPAAGKWLQAVDSNGTVAWVTDSALPSDPKLFGINVRQGSSVADQRFNGQQFVRYYFIGSPPTQYLSGNSNNVVSTSEVRTQLPIWRTATFENLACIMQANAVTYPRVFIVRINEANSALTCTIAVGQRICTNTSASVAVSTGDRVALEKAVQPAASTFTQDGACYFEMIY